MKNILKATLFIIILLLLIFFLSLVFSHFRTVKGDNISVIGIIGEKKNSLDYLVLGDSETYTSVIPLELWHKYGYTGYVLGSPAQRLSQTKEILEESLKNQKPKLVLFETNAIFRKLRDYDMVKIVLKNRLPIFKYHDNWKYFLNKDFSQNTLNEKGYAYNNTIKKATNIKEKKPTDKRREVDEENIKYFEEILSICKENNIQVILISVPSLKNWSYKKHNTMLDFSKKYNLDFIDFNLDNSLNINWETDTKDAGDHLNYYGALKLTASLGQYLDNKKILPDHRKDEYYKDWHKNYKQYMLKFDE